MRDRLPAAALVLALVALSCPAWAQDGASAADETGGDRVFFDGSFTVPAGSRHTGSVTALGGTVVVDGEVTGDVVVIGGELTVRGRIGQEVVAVFSDVTLEKGARVDFALANIGGHLVDRGARVGHDYVDVPLGLTLPFAGSPLGLLGFFFVLRAGMALLTALAAILLANAVVPERLERVAAAMAARPGRAVLYGLLAYVPFPALVLFLVLTCLGIPLVPLVVLLYWIAKWFGLAALFLLAGRRMRAVAGSRLSAMLLGLLPFALLRLVPFVGAIVFWALGLFAVGAVLATRGGAAAAADSGAAPAPA